MENVKVTFKGEKREINIDFKYNTETGNLDYKVNVDPPIESGDNTTLEVFLADQFLGTLVNNSDSKSESNESNSEEKVETKSEE